MQTEQVVERAQKLLSDTLGENVSLQPAPELPSQNLVLRCAVVGSSSLQSVILKQSTPEKFTAERQPWLRKRFMNEWASLQFLSGLPQAHTARWLAGDAESGLLLVEDLGVYPSIQKLLFDEDEQVALQALDAFAAALAQLQCAAVGKEEAFRSLQAKVGTTSPWCDGSIDVRTLLPVIRECLEALQVTPAAGFEEEVQAVGAAIHDEALFRTLCHCDLGMHNALWLGDGRVRIVDFEFSNFQHALVDIVCARMTYPCAYHGRPVPHSIYTQLENIYRGELAKSVAAAQDDRLFYDGLVQASAQWTFSEIGGMWNVYFKERLQQGDSYDTQDGRTLEGSAHFRQRLFDYLRAFIACAEEFDRLPAARETLTRLLDALRRYWDVDAAQPSFPALAVNAK